MRGNIAQEGSTVRTDRIEPFVCGTHRAAQHHRRMGQPLDEACKEADAAYMRDYRKNKQSDKSRERVRLRNAARGRALSRLAELHQIDYMILFVEEQRAAGLIPQRRTP